MFLGGDTDSGPTASGEPAAVARLAVPPATVTTATPAHSGAQAPPQVVQVVTPVQPPVLVGSPVQTYQYISHQGYTHPQGWLQPCPRPASMYQPTSSSLHPATRASGFAKLQQQVNTQLEPEYRMLLLGQTGSGKTSFLNLLCNLAKVMKLGAQGPEQEAEAVNQMRDYNNLDLESGEGCMTSKTSGATMYKIPDMDIGGDPLDILVMDTPGFGDTRGLEYDKEHARLIVEELESVSHVNCICLVVNGREARMNHTLRYVLSELTAILPRIVVSNVIVVFTNTSDALERNFDPRELEPFFGQAIPDEHIFCVENPYCKLAKTREKQGSLSVDTIAKSLQKAFSEAAEMFADMYAILRKLPPVHTKHFNEMFDVKRQIDREMFNLLAQYQRQMCHEEEIRKAQKELEAAKQETQLYKHFETKQVVSKWVSMPTDKHNTLCGAQGCYSNCHSPCVMPKTLDKSVFKECTAFSWNAKPVSILTPRDMLIVLDHMIDIHGPLRRFQEVKETTEATYLKAQSAFVINGVFVEKGAWVDMPTDPGAHCAADLTALPLPVNLQFHDDLLETCQICGHDYKLHYHDEVRWVQETVEEKLVDEAMKAKFQKASGLAQQKQVLQCDFANKLRDSQEKRQVLAAQLLSSIDKFQQLGMNRDFVKMLHTQRDLVLQHLEVYESEKGERNAELRSTLTEIDKKLKLVEESARQGAMQRAQEAIRPKYWSVASDGNFVKRLDPTLDKDVRTVLAEMLQTDHPEWLGQGRDVRQKEAYTKLSLVDAWRVESMEIYKRYDQEKRRIKGEIDTRSIPIDDPNIRPCLRESSAKLPGDLLDGANEVRVLHGTKPANVFPILSDGFNERVSGGPRSYFGQTLYFAEDAGKCDQYCTADCKDGIAEHMDANDAKMLHELLYSSSGEHLGEVFYVFVCRHVVGKFVRTKSKEPNAPNLDQPAYCVWANSQRREFACIPGLNPPVRYHSLIAEVGEDILRYREIVQSRAERVYPEYLIAYKRSA